MFKRLQLAVVVVKPELLHQWWIRWALCLSIALLFACSSSSELPSGSSALNSRYNDEQPALSGNGRFLAFASNRNGSHLIMLYDLQLQQLLPLPRLNRRETIAESPSLSYTGRYITYVTSDQGKPEVALYDRATQQSQVLTQWYLGLVRHPSISPNGRYIVFETGSHGQWDIEVLDRGPNIELDISDGAPVRPLATPSP